MILLISAGNASARFGVHCCLWLREREWRDILHIQWTMWTYSTAGLKGSRSEYGRVFIKSLAAGWIYDDWKDCEF